MMDIAVHKIGIIISLVVDTAIKGFLFFFVFAASKLPPITNSASGVATCPKEVTTLLTATGIVI